MERLLLVGICFCIGSGAQAVTGSDIQARYSLVGVIAAERDDEKSIVVLKDRQTRRSLTLTEGQTLPSNGRWVIGRVYRNTVVLQKGHEQIRVTYAGTAHEDVAEQPSSIAGAEGQGITVEVKKDDVASRATNYHDQNNVQYLDNLVSNSEALDDQLGQDREHEALKEYERHLERELRRVRAEQEEADDAEAQPVAGERIRGGDGEQQEPVFNDLPDGPTYFQ